MHVQCDMCVQCILVELTVEAKLDVGTVAVLHTVTYMIYRTCACIMQLGENCICIELYYCIRRRVWWRYFHSRLMVTVASLLS